MAASTASRLSVNGNTYMAELLKVTTPIMSFLRWLTKSLIILAAATDLVSPTRPSAVPPEKGSSILALRSITMPICAPTPMRWIFCSRLCGPAKPKIMQNRLMAARIFSSKPIKLDSGSLGNMATHE